MSAVDTVVKIFGLMTEADKKETVLQIGKICEDEGLTASWETKSSPRKGGKTKRRGSWKPYWMRTVVGIKDDAKGFDKLDGAWVNVDDIAKGRLIDGVHVVVGVKSDPKKYHVCKTKFGARTEIDTPTGFINVHGMENVHTCDTFGGVISYCEESL
jgi:hypothetical protein